MGMGEAFGGAAVVCWIFRVLAVPRSALPGYEPATTVYVRLLGRQRTLLFFAFVFTLAAFLAWVFAQPAPIDPDLQAVRRTHAQCGTIFDNNNRPICITLEPGGIWVEREQGEDRQWLLVATFPARPDAILQAPSHCSFVMPPGDCQ